MNLFEQSMEKDLHIAAPLAARMRPASLAEFAEQYKIVGAGSLLRRSIEMDRLMSAIFYGPPGTGKTTLALIIANITKARFVTINAVMAGVADIRNVVSEAKESMSLHQKRTVLFIDEIHRFNKAQQDALLPFVENGLFTLIGSTAENPLFTVNRPLLSRSQLYRFEPLSKNALVKLLTRALSDEEKGLGNYRVEADAAALTHLAQIANGDARAALNALELAVMTTLPEKDGVRRITLEVAEEAVQKKVIRYNREDEHYDVISAFIKSMRGSDPHATLYWLARMLYAGEDPAFISRRIIILAAEDIGLADPQALVVATSAAQAVERIGMPESRLILAEAALYMATAPKSNAVITGITKAMAIVENDLTPPVPPHIRSSDNKGYKYPHNYPGNYVKQNYLPPGISGKVFYTPSANGKEAAISDYLNKLGRGKEDS
ncbi:MAG: replication-associated recombination protein A [Peptococcaceae bacterium]|nr:replication-associated recombination protein A [Peptococcaceae bacterium]